LLALELLEQVGLEVGAARHLHDLEQGEERDVVVEWIRERHEVPGALEQVLETKQRADPLVEGIFVRDHVRANCRYFWWSRATSRRSASRLPLLSRTSSAAA